MKKGPIRSIAFSIALIIAVFVLMFEATDDIWSATNSAGIVSLVFMIAVAIRMVRLYTNRTHRITIGVFSSLVILALVVHWVIMWRMTEWQCDNLQGTRRTIFDSAVLTTLRPAAIDTYREYRQSPAGTTFKQVFERRFPHGVLPPDTHYAVDTGPTYATVSDTSIRFVGEARYVAGYDEDFVNHDGRHGLAQIVVRVTPKGVSYDVQN